LGRAWGGNHRVDHADSTGLCISVAAALLKNGAGYMQIAAFVSTLMMVGV
jgi:hypothetical protein